MTTTQKPPSSIITADLVNDSLGYTATAFDSTGGSEAQAASLYPGTLVVQGPSLLCSEGVLPFSCPVNPPSYPLLADASYPQSQHASASPRTSPIGKNTALVATPANSTATATQTTATGQTTTGSSTVLAGTPVAMSIGSESSSSKVLTKKRSAVVTVVSHASDIEVGGVLHIGSVTGRDVQRLAAGHAPIDRPTLSISDVTVAGKSASIGPKGLQVAGHSAPKLLHTLVTHGITVQPVTVTRHDSKHGARSDTTGLVITTSLPLKGAPYIPNPLSGVPPFNQIPGVDLSGTYISTVQFGAVGAASGIEQQANVGMGKLGKLPVTPTPPAPHKGSTVTTTPGTGGGAGRPAPAPSTAGGGKSPRVAAPASPLRFLADTTDLERLYLVLALGAAALFVGWRLRVVSRPGTWLRRHRT